MTPKHLSPSDIATYGWTAYPLSLDTNFSKTTSSASQPLSLDTLLVPSSRIAKRVQEHARDALPAPTYNHSMRVYLYGAAIVAQHFPELTPCLETYFLACLLHDIGTAPQHIDATAMSFEFYGGLLSLRLLTDEEEVTAPKAQAEGVVEAVIRHQDLGSVGMGTGTGMVLRFATVLDNIGQYSALVHPTTVENVVLAYPRNKWSSCFASTIREEIGLKPWCHTTVIPHFAESVEENKLMKPYE